MPSNVEIKARLRDLAGARERLGTLADGQPRRLVQEDTFFHVRSGRLKLRVTDGCDAELIAYHREDAAGPKPSRYTVVRSPDAAPLREALAATCGVRGIVRKRRAVYVVGRTRIHLDEVDSLGTFLEMECVLGEGEPAGRGVREVRVLMGALGVEERDLVRGAYLDLLEGRE